MNLQVTYDNFASLGIAPTVVATSGARTQATFDLGIDAPALHRNIGCALTWSSSEGVSLYEWQPSFIPGPEDSIDRPTDWMDAGSIHYKFVHGCRILADTGGVARTVQVQYDGGQLGPVLTVNHNGQLALPYTFPPFKARLLRLVPTDAAAWRLWSVEWEVDNEPDPVNYWVTQPTSWGLPGYLHIRDFQFAYATAIAGAILTLIVDGVNYVIAASLPATGGMEVKQYYPAPPVKGKVWQLYATGTGLQIYGKDCEFRVKSWAGPGYQALKPIGDDTVTSGGARI